MKTKKTYILSLLLVIVLICSCVSCTNRKNARKNLLTEIKNICEQKLNTIDYYNFAAEDFVLDDEVRTLCKTYLMIDSSDKEVTALSVIVNSSEEDFITNIEAFRKDYPRSCLMEYVDYLEEFGLLGISSKPELIPDFEKKYPGSVFIEHMEIEQFHLFFDEDYFTSIGYLVRDACLDYDESWTDDQVTASIFKIVIAIAFSDSSDDFFTSEDYSDGQDSEDSLSSREYLQSIKDVFITEELIPSFIEKYPESRVNPFLLQASEIFAIWDYTSEDDSDKGNYLFEKEKVKMIDEYLSKYDNELGREYLESERDSYQKSIETYENKVADKIWAIKTYVNNYNEYTEQKYLTNEDISGIYTSPTADRKEAAIRFLVDSERKIAFKLYEQGDTVRGINISNDSYFITVKDSFGSEYTFNGTNWDDRVTLNSVDSQKLNSLMRAGQELKFHIERTTYGYQSNYAFTVDTTGYNGVFERL